MRKFDLSLRSSRSSYFATFRHQLTILSKTDSLVDGERSQSKSFSSCARIRSEERFSRNAETDLVCRLLLEKKKDQVRAAAVQQRTVAVCGGNVDLPCDLIAVMPLNSAG